MTFEEFTRDKLAVLPRFAAVLTGEPVDVRGKHGFYRADM